MSFIANVQEFIITNWGVFITIHAVITILISFLKNFGAFIIARIPPDYSVTINFITFFATEAIWAFNEAFIITVIILLALGYKRKIEECEKKRR